jgi:anti-anti-sigma factor
MADPIAVGERVQRRKGIRVGLSGELDLQCLPELRATLRAALGSRRRVWVDLSEVTFMDALCLRELAVQYQLHPDRLVLWRPSPEVKLAVAICEAEDWVGFRPERCHLPFTRKREPTPRGSRQRLPPQAAPDPAFFIVEADDEGTR